MKFINLHSCKNTRISSTRHRPHKWFQTSGKGRQGTLMELQVLELELETVPLEALKSWELNFTQVSINNIRRIRTMVLKSTVVWINKRSEETGRKSRGELKSGRSSRGTILSKWPLGISRGYANVSPPWGRVLIRTKLLLRPDRICKFNLRTFPVSECLTSCTVTASFTRNDIRESPTSKSSTSVFSRIFTLPSLGMLGC